jgi:hypothetical protein
MRRGLLPTVLAAILMTTACTGDRGPSERPAAPGGAATPTASASPEPVRVVAPWQKGMPEYGINIYWENSQDDSEEVMRAKAARILDYVVDLNANSVAFTFPIYTAGIRSTTLRPGAKTPGPERVGIAVEEATRRGLRSTVRPILNEKVLVDENPKAWRGTIRPGSRDKWFGNYRKLILPYVASSAGAATFVVGTEFNSLEGDRRWKALIAAVKDKFPGEVAYSANFDSFQTGEVGVPADVIGVDAYPRLNLDDDASVGDIAARWGAWLRRHRIDGPPVVHEAGIAAQNSAYRNPGHWGDGSRKLNLKVQQRWYEGLCEALHDGDASGVYWWKVDFDTDPAKADEASPDRMTFVGRPVEESIRECFGKQP